MRVKLTFSETIAVALAAAFLLGQLSTLTSAPGLVALLASGAAIGVAEYLSERR